MDLPKFFIACQSHEYTFLYACFHDFFCINSIQFIANFIKNPTTAFVMPLNPMISNKINELTQSKTDNKILNDILEQVVISLEQTGDRKNEMPVEVILDKYVDASGDL